MLKLIASKIVMVCVASLVVWPTVSLAKSDPYNAKDYQRAASVFATLFYNHKFTELMALEKAYTANKARSKNGEHRLGFYYDQVDGFMRPSHVRRKGNGELSGGDAHTAINKWLVKHPDSVAARIAFGVYLRNHSSKIDFVQRNAGASWWLKRPPEGYWKASERVLQPLWQLPERSAQLHVIKLQNLLVESVGMERLLKAHKAAKLAFPYYEPIHFTVFDGLVKRARKMYPDASQSPDLPTFLRTMQPETGDDQGAGMYARLVMRAQRRYFGNKVIEVLQPDWEVLLAGLKEVTRSYPTSGHLNTAAKLSCLAGKRRAVDTFLSRLKVKVDKAAWKDLHLFTACVAWAKG